MDTDVVAEDNVLKVRILRVHNDGRDRSIYVPEQSYIVFTEHRGFYLAWDRTWGATTLQA